MPVRCSSSTSVRWLMVPEPDKATFSGRVWFGIGDEGAEIRRRQVGPRHQHLRRHHQHRDRRELLERVLVEIGIEARIDRDGVADDQQRVAVRRRIGDKDRAGGIACAGLVLDDDRLGPDRAQSFGEDARDRIDRTAGRRRHDQPHRARGKLRRVFGLRASEPRPLHTGQTAATTKRSACAGMSVSHRERNEQIVDLDRSGDQRLLVQILHERIQRRPVGLDAVGKRRRHRTPGRSRRRGRQATAACSAATPGCASCPSRASSPRSALVEAGRDERMLLVDVAADRDEMHDRKDPRAQEIVLLRRGSRETAARYPGCGRARAAATCR